MDKLKAFESFVSVATRGSLTAAAKAEGVAPAIMGRRLDALEEHLGVKLLVRTTRRISLTHDLYTEVKRYGTVGFLKSRLA